MRLALAFGEKDPDLMLADLDERLFRRWMEYFEAEPFGQAVQTQMLAKIAAAVFQVQGSDCTLRDFLPKFGDDS